jgi:RimJ/RimL family protein N-acetyltransferase
MSTGPTAPTLTDGVVTIRAHREDDAQRVHEQCQDPLSQAWTTVPIPYSIEDARTFVGEIMPGGWAEDSEWSFAIEHEGRFGGTISLRNEGQGRAEIAFGSHPDVRGTGVVERALRLLLDWGFETRGLRMVVWWANVGNWPSRRAAHRLGFSFDGTVRHWLPQRGELIDGWVGTLLRDEPREPRSTWLDCPVVEGDGVRLRPMTEADVPRIVEAGSDLRMHEWLGFMFPALYTAAHATRFVESARENQAQGRGVAWAVTGEDDVMLGWVSVFGIQPGVAAELGYWAHPDARGRGYTSRAVAAAERHARDVLGLRLLRASVAPDNAASHHVLEVNGFGRTGVQRLGTEVRGERADLVLYDKSL